MEDAIEVHDRVGEPPLENLPISDRQRRYEEDLMSSDTGQMVHNILTSGTRWDDDTVDIHMTDGRVITSIRRRLMVFLTHQISTGKLNAPQVLGWRTYHQFELNEVSSLKQKEVNQKCQELGIEDDMDYHQFQRFLMFHIQDASEFSDYLLTPEIYERIYSTELADALCVPRNDWKDYSTFKTEYQDLKEQERFWTSDTADTDDDEWGS